MHAVITYNTCVKCRYVNCSFAVNFIWLVNAAGHSLSDMLQFVFLRVLCSCRGQKKWKPMVMLFKPVYTY